MVILKLFYFGVKYKEFLSTFKRPPILKLILLIGVVKFINKYLFEGFPNKINTKQIT